MSTRIYVVTDLHQNPVRHRLVRASNTAQALRHVAEDQLTVELANQQTLVDLSVAGVKVESLEVET